MSLGTWESRQTGEVGIGALPLIWVPAPSTGARDPSASEHLLAVRPAVDLTSEAWKESPALNSTLASQGPLPVQEAPWPCGRKKVFPKETPRKGEGDGGIGRPLGEGSAGMAVPGVGHEGTHENSLWKGPGGVWVGSRISGPERTHWPIPTLDVGAGS